MLDGNAKSKPQRASADVNADDLRCQVEDDFIEPIPITCREVAVIESYLADLIEELIGGRPKAR